MKHETRFFSFYVSCYRFYVSCCMFHVIYFIAYCSAAKRYWVRKIFLKGMMELIS